MGGKEPRRKRVKTAEKSQGRKRNGEPPKHEDEPGGEAAEQREEQ